MSSTGMWPRDFYPRPPRGGRPQIRTTPAILWRFLSTPSARRATDEVKANNALIEISIHALREEGDKICLYGEWRIPISIHALREEGDITDHSAYLAGAIFLSTPSARRATLADLGCTITSEFLSTPSARRATSESFSAANCTAPFLSTPSARRATKGNGHGLLPKRFLSTPSARRATEVNHAEAVAVVFLSTPSARRATRVSEPRDPGRIHFYPRPPRGGRLEIAPQVCEASHFYPRPPRGGRLVSGRC